MIAIDTNMAAAQGNPVGIAISHCADANTTFWSVLWSYGGKVLEADGRTRFTLEHVAHVVLLVWVLSGMLASGMAPSIAAAAHDSVAVRIASRLSFVAPK